MYDFMIFASCLVTANFVSALIIWAMIRIVWGIRERRNEIRKKRIKDILHEIELEKWMNR